MPGRRHATLLEDVLYDHEGDPHLEFLYGRVMHDRVRWADSAVLPPPEPAPPQQDRRTEAELMQMVDASLDRLCKEVDTAKQSAAVTEFLQAMARFWRYSWNNNWLIMIQRPNATRVAGYRTWQSFGRQVKKGERAIRILAPSTFKRRRQVKVKNPDTGVEEEKEDVEEVIRYFISVPVFDISQTEGPELPQLQWYVRGASHEKWIEVFDKVLKEFGWTIHRTPLGPGEGNGYAIVSAQTIVVSTTTDPNTQVATSAHEAGHVILHTYAQRREFQLSRDDLELEAEAVSYVVCTYLGIETGPAHANYIANWGGDGVKLRAHFSRIQQAASKIIGALEAAVAPAAAAPAPSDSGLVQLWPPLPAPAPAARAPSVARRPVPQGELYRVYVSDPHGEKRTEWFWDWVYTYRKLPELSRATGTEVVTIGGLYYLLVFETPDRGEALEVADESEHQGWGSVKIVYRDRLLEGRR